MSKAEKELGLLGDAAFKELAAMEATGKNYSLWVEVKAKGNVLEGFNKYGSASMRELVGIRTLVDDIISGLVDQMTTPEEASGDEDEY